MKEFMVKVITGKPLRIGNHRARRAHHESAWGHTFVPQVCNQHQVLEADALNELCRITGKRGLHPACGFTDHGWTGK